MSSFIEYNDLFDRLTDNAKSSLRHADGIARGLGNQYVGTEHILLGVLAQRGSIGAKVLGDSGVTLERAKVALNLTPKPVIVDQGAKGLSETAKLTLRMSLDIAQEFNQEICGTEHILFSILAQKNARATVLLRDMNIDLRKVTVDLEHYLNRQQYEYDATSTSQTGRKKKRRGSALDYFGINLTDSAHNNELDPVVGRENQIKRVITILNRRTKNNPVLIGEPGVGKTAIVEGLAQRIANGDVPDSLSDARIVMLDLAGMIAGTKYRGEFEERFKRVLSEVTNDKNTLIFIDEMHLLVGAGAAEGAVDAASILKPALARGKIRVIGATTTEEYNKHVEKDSAFERRFQPVIVPEATSKESLAILKGIKKHYEAHHGVKIDDDVLEDAVYYAKRYNNDRSMPDKAIDLIDEAAARVRVDRGKIPSEQKKLIAEQRLLTDKMNEAGEAEDYERAAHYKTRVSRISIRLKQIRAKNNRQQNLKINKDDIAEVIATMTGVPVNKVLKPEAKFLINLEKHLERFLIGQGYALNAVAKAIRRNRSGVSDSKRPIGSFVFLGPTGVGKTETARVLAREFFHNDDSLIKIDMSEFSERHTVSRLVGAPAGYIGYDEGGQLTDKIRRQPYSLVLFDEIEKAHPEVFNMLLQILEDGVLTDAKGRQVDFTNTIIIMTSNVGAEKLQKEAVLGFQASKTDELEKLNDVHEQNQERVIDELKSLMKPELINRIDKIIVFRALTKKDATKILDLQLNDLKNRLVSKGIGLEVTTSAKALLINMGYDALNGVRPLRRSLQDTIEDYLANGLLAGEYNQGDVIKVYAKNKHLSYSVIHG